MWIPTIVKKGVQYLMGKDEVSTTNFLNLEREVRRCDTCKTPFSEGVLDRLSSNFICPACDNGKEDE